jgi:disulfide bond formation protein DsbB
MLSDKIDWFHPGILFIALALATILGAWGFEYAGYKPCPLCLAQRLPYYTAIPAAAAALILERAGRRDIAGGLYLACMAVMIIGAGAGIYHSGVEWHFWQGSAACSNLGGLDMSKNLLPNLTDKSFVSCTEAALRIFGISLAGYNALIAAALAVLAWLAARRVSDA